MIPPTTTNLDGRCGSACHYPLELPHLPYHQSCSPNFHLFVLMPETGVENDASRAAQRSRWPEEPVPSIECCYPRSLLYSLSKYRDSARPFHSFPPPPTARWIPDHSAGLTPSALGSSYRLIHPCLAIGIFLPRVWGPIAGRFGSGAALLIVSHP